MAIINNHSNINLDASFQSKHKELFKVFSNNNVDVDINDDFDALKTFLESIPKDDYPYRFDGSFRGIDDTQNAFVLYLKKGDEIISTYAAVKMSKDGFVEGMKVNNAGTYENIDIGSGTQFYSSCQWVSKDHRGKKLGMCLDHLKKNIIFDILNGDVNYAIHKEALKGYHNDGLRYDTSSKLATIPKGDVGGAGEAIDKIYNMTWTTKTSWTNKQDDVKKLYI